MIFEDGILVKHLDKILILVPKTKLNNFKYKNKQFVSKDKKTILSVNSLINVIVIDCKYENNNFKCIGNLIN